MVLQDGLDQCGVSGLVSQLGNSSSNGSISGCEDRDALSGGDEVGQVGCLQERDELG